MPTLNLVAELSVDDLLDVVSNLDERELEEFETRFEQMWLSYPESIAEARRLLPHKQAHLRTLLEQNREGYVTQTETEELDQYIANIDQTLEDTAADLMKLAERRQQEKGNGAT